MTGGAGFIGRNIVDQLCRQGEAVRVLDLKADSDLHPAAEIFTGSVTDADTVAAAMTGVDVVYHVAGNPQLWNRDKSGFYEVNVGGTQTVLDAARRFGVERVVFTSSMTTLVGRRSPRWPTRVDERTRLSANDMLGEYCRSKLMAEELALDRAAGGLPVVIVIPTMPVGPGDVNLTPPSRMILDFVNGRASAYLDSVMNIADVRAVAEGHIAARTRGRIGERYILGGRNLRLGRLLQILAEVSGTRMPSRRVPYALALAVAGVSEFVADKVTNRPPIAPLTGVRLARRQVVFDTRKAVHELGLERRPIRTAIAEAVEWFRSQDMIRESDPALRPAAT